MTKGFRVLIHTLCSFGIALNTALFGLNLFNGLGEMAFFNLLCAGGCWIGYFKFGEIKDGDE